MISHPYGASRRKILLPGLLAAATSALYGNANAQDTRNVREPVVPPACAVLAAEPSAAGRDDAKRIQVAIDGCAPGHAVHLAPRGANLAFTSGPLVLKSGVTLVVDAGATLYASADPMVFDRGNRTCGSNDASGRGCRPFITVEKTSGAGIMGDGVIDGQGGHTIEGKGESWWQIARRAQKENTRQNVPRLIQIVDSRDFTMYRILLRNSPNFHVAMSRVDGFTAWGVKIDTPHDARNTDGIDPGASRNVTIAYSWIRTGDDNVAIKAGSGLTENVSILHNHFYHGHGMSIGSETNGGVRNVLVEDLDMDGTTSGLRIKSDDRRGGTLQNVVFRNVCLRGDRWPLYIDTHYGGAKQAPGQLIPSYADVRMENVHSLSPGDGVILEGYDEQHPLQLALENVVVDGKPKIKTAFARLTGQLNAPHAQPLDCNTRFAPFPAPTSAPTH